MKAHSLVTEREIYQNVRKSQNKRNLTEILNFFQKQWGDCHHLHFP